MAGAQGLVRQRDGRDAGRTHPLLLVLNDSDDRRVLAGQGAVRRDDVFRSALTTAKPDYPDDVPSIAGLKGLRGLRSRDIHRGRACWRRARSNRLC